MRLRSTLPAVALAAAVATAASAQVIKFDLLAKGAMPKLGGYVPLRLSLSAQKPDHVKRTPVDAAAARFGVIRIGPAESPTQCTVMLDETAGQPARLWIDTNGDGDLTNDPPALWQRRELEGSGGKQVSYHGGGAVLVQYQSKPVPLHIEMYRFDPSDPKRASLKDVLLYYPDYALEGKLTLAGEAYRAMLWDARGSGDFRPAPATAKGPATVRLVVDLNRDGRFASIGETFDAAKPFNLKGTTYELKIADAAGGRAELVKSAVTVAEIPPPPDLSIGKQAPAFRATTTDGNALDFPAAYKGKIVLLDFWATWCGPCVGEIPNLVKVYEKTHARGLEVLGISLDQTNMSERLAAFTREKSMPWPQVYDGKYWDAAVARLYGIRAIPAPFLVDGDTGAVLASGPDLRGAQLEKTIEAALAKRR